MPRRTTRSTKKREDAAAKENEAANEQPPPAPPKNPKVRADGKKTAANASTPQALKPFGDLSDDEIRAGIEEEGVVFVERHSGGVDDVTDWFWENLGVRVTAQKVDGKLVVKLRKGLRMDGLGVGINGEEIAVTTQDVNNVKNSRNAWKTTELAAYFTHLTTFPPKKGASATVIAGEIIEYLESNGERFFVGQTMPMLRQELHRLSPGSREPRHEDRGNLVRALRRASGFTHTNYQPTSSNARRADGNDVNFQFPQDDAPDQSANNRAAAAAAFGGDASGGGDALGGDAAGGVARPSNLNVVPETPQPQQSSVGNGGGNKLFNIQSEALVELLRQSKEGQALRREDQALRREELAQQTKVNESLVKKNEEQDGEREELMRQMIVSNKRVSTLEDRSDKLETVQFSQGQRLDDYGQRLDNVESRHEQSAIKEREQDDELKSVRKDIEMMKAIVGWNASPNSPDSKRGLRHSFGPNDGGVGDQTEADDDEALSLSPKVLTFAEGGKVSADKAEAEELKLALIATFGKDDRFHSVREQLQQATSLSTDTFGGIFAEMLRVFGSSEYSSEFMFDLMALLPSVAGLLGVNFKIFLLDTLSKYENFMEKMNEDDSPDGLRKKNLLLKSYHKLIQSLDTDNVLTSMIAELEVEKKDYGVHNVMNGILHLSSMMTQAVTLDVPGEREIVEAKKAREIVALWTQILTDQSRKVRTILDGNATESELGNVVLCDRIRLSGKSFTAKAADVIAAFLKESFMGGRSIASGILCIEFDDIIAGQSTDVGLHVLRTFCDAVADAELVDVNLSDNAIGQLGIGACKNAFKPSLEGLALCNNGLSEDTMKEVADTLLRSGCVANLTKVHFYNNMSGEEGCKEFARILEESSNLTDIRFSGTRAGEAGSDIVAQALGAALEEGRNTNLEKLDLYDNNFGNEASQAALVSVIERAPLSYLNLGSCELGNGGVNKICGALVNHDSSLEHLDLSCNEVDIHGAEHIAGYIRDSGGQLKSLFLGDNELGNGGVNKICGALVNHNSSLEDLNLSYSNMGDIGARALIDAVSAGKLPNLKKISLDGNYFTEDIVRALVDVFGDNLEEMKENNPDGEADDDLSDDDSNEEADDNVPDVAGDNGADDDSELADAFNRLSMNSS